MTSSRDVSTATVAQPCRAASIDLALGRVPCDRQRCVALAVNGRFCAAHEHGASQSNHKQRVTRSRERTKPLLDEIERLELLSRLTQSPKRTGT